MATGITGIVIKICIVCTRISLTTEFVCAEINESIPVTIPATIPIKALIIAVILLFRINSSSTSEVKHGFACFTSGCSSLSLFKYFLATMSIMAFYQKKHRHFKLFRE